MRSSFLTEAIALKAMAICSRSDALVTSKPFTAAPAGRTEASVRFCGRRRALGGGVVWNDTAPAPELLKVSASGPLDASRSISDTKDGDVAKLWYAVVDNSAGFNQEVEVFAVCSRRSRARIEATALHVEDHNHRMALTRCRKGRTVVGGGVVQKGPPNSLFIVRANGPLAGTVEGTEDGDRPRKWVASVYNLLDEPERDFKVLATCE